MTRKVAIVTGSSRGVGAQAVKQLAAGGWDVCLNCSSSESEAREVAKRCEDAGAKTHLVIGDVSDDSLCQRLISETLEKFGRLDALVNNAGTTKFAAHHELGALSMDDFVRIYQVNTVAPYQLVRAAAPHLIEARGSVLNVASIAGIHGLGSSIAYCCSKAALICMTKSLARVLPGVRINALCPGFIQGEWLEQGLGKEVYQMAKQHWEDTSPLTDTCDAERVAQVIVQFLEGMPLITGEALLMDGGYSLGGQIGGARR